MSDKGFVVGIDLGTTNSEIAAYVEGRVRVLGPEDRILPSCVGFSASGELLVGHAARNQELILPELTVRSVKRRMGSLEPIRLGEKEFTPQEISSFILRELVRWAEKVARRKVSGAVITVPAYFSDAQRNATREAGALAGLEVLRILNEPTAASLAYGFDGEARRTVMVYDLGGGTFDVSIVSNEKDVTEVLSSHGNTQLGGDDFDRLLVDRLATLFQERHGLDPRQGQPVALARLWRAAEEAKKVLSFESYATVREEGLITVDGEPLHLECELSRSEYEEMIRALVESTLESVSKAMADAGKQPGQLDAILLVGGSTRTPLVWKVLEERAGIAPRQDVHPDLCVALGAGVLASRLGGQAVDRVLVDVSPYSFGPSYLGTLAGCEYPYCYHPIIRRNTPLPVTRTDSYFTATPYQQAVEVEIFQGDDSDALKNLPVGRFTIEGLQPMMDQNEVLCRMSLDLDGILHVTAIEKCTGKSKHIAIANSLQPLPEEELARAKERLGLLFAVREGSLEEQGGDWLEEGFAADDGLDVEPAPRSHQEMPTTPSAWERVTEEAEALLNRSRILMEQVHPEDREELIDLNERLLTALGERNEIGLASASGELKELLFFIEGR